jgi:hypothetical protein
MDADCERSEDMNCQNANPCPCPSKSCPYIGRCCDCVASHRASGDLPVCLRAPGGKK